MIVSNIINQDQEHFMQLTHSFFQINFSKLPLVKIIKSNSYDLEVNVKVLSSISKLKYVYILLFLRISMLISTKLLKLFHKEYNCFKYTLTIKKFSYNYSK